VPRLAGLRRRSLALAAQPPEMNDARQPVAAGHQCVLSDQAPELIIPAPTVTPVASSMRMKEPVVRFWE